MIRFFLVVVLAWLLALGGCASIEQPDSVSVQSDEAAGRQVLMMLRQAPRQYRPEQSYFGGYGPADRLASRRVAQRIATDHGATLSFDWPMAALGVECFVLSIPSGMTASDMLARLAADPRVESAQAMHLFNTLQRNDPMYSLQPATRAWRLSEIHTRATGQGIVIAQIDSAVDVAHSDLRDRVASQSNFVDTQPSVAEPHGTAVAGIMVASADNRLGIVGVAPGAQLLSLRACWEDAGSRDGMCSTFTLARALQFALDRNVRVINLSLGGPKDRLLERLLDVALARGVTVVAAFDDRASDGGFPASHRGVVAVAGTARAGPDGGKALLAPGRDIPTTVPGNRWDLVNGSSFAAAHVSGLVALILESAPKIDAKDLLDALNATTDSPEPGKPRQIEACKAMERASTGCFCNCKQQTGALSLRQ
jgi:Subtilase family